MAARRRVILAGGEEPSGMPEEFWLRRKAEAERRMALIDAAPAKWRALVNEFDQAVVAEASAYGMTAREARWFCERVRGRQV